MRRNTSRDKMKRATKDSVLEAENWCKGKENCFGKLLNTVAGKTKRKYLNHFKVLVLSVCFSCSDRKASGFATNQSRSSEEIQESALKV